MKCATFVLPGVPIKPLFDRLVWALGSYSPFHEAAGCFETSCVQTIDQLSLC